MPAIHAFASLISPASKAGRSSSLSNAQKRPPANQPAAFFRYYAYSAEADTMRLRATTRPPRPSTSINPRETEVPVSGTGALS